MNAAFVPFRIQERGLSHRREGKCGLLCLCQQQGYNLIAQHYINASLRRVFKSLVLMLFTVAFLGAIIVHSHIHSLFW